MKRKDCEYIKVCGECWDNIPVRRDSDVYGENEFVSFGKGIKGTSSVLLKQSESDVM